MQKIEELSRERERLLKEEGSRNSGEDLAQELERVDHRLRVLWDLRRRELAGEPVNADDDFLDDYDRYGGRENAPN